MNDNHSGPGRPESLGDRFRALVEPALNDPRRQQVQLEIVDGLFMRFAAQLEAQLNATLDSAFQQAAAIGSKSPSEKNIFLIRQLTETDQNGEAKLPAVLRRQLPVCTTFLELSAEDVKELPGYIALHEKARELNVALKISGITMDETKSPGGYPMPVLLVIDMSKTYEEGAMENAQLYPQLPPRKPVPPQFNRKAGGGFEF